MWFKPPGWRPTDVAAKFPKADFDITHARFNPDISRVLGLYAMVQFAVVLLIGVHFLGAAPKLALLPAVAYAVYLTLSVCVIGAILEGRASAIWFEVIRTGGTALAVLLTGAWFGIAHLDGRIVLGIAVFFGLSALTAVVLSRYEHKSAPAMHHAAG